MRNETHIERAAWLAFLRNSVANGADAALAEAAWTIDSELREFWQAEVAEILRDAGERAA